MIKILYQGASASVGPTGGSVVSTGASVGSLGAPEGASVAFEHPQVSGAVDSRKVKHCDDVKLPSSTSAHVRLEGRKPRKPVGKTAAGFVML